MNGMEVWARVSACVCLRSRTWECVAMHGCGCGCVCVSVRACEWSESLRETKKSILLLMSLEIDGISVRL